MDILGFLAATAVTKEGVVEQPVFKPLSNQHYISGKPLPLMDESVGQVTPVHQLYESTQQLTTEQNEQWKRVQDLETRVSDLEVQQFSPTGFLEGEVNLGFSGVSGKALEDSIVFQESVELTLNVSFTGEDTLEIGLESGNFREFLFVGELTFEGRLGFLDDTDDNRFELSELSYEFPLSEEASLFLSTDGDDLSDFNPFFDTNDNDGLSEFGTENPIHNLVEDAGVQLDYDLTEELSISLGYFSGEANDPESGAGLFNGSHSNPVRR